MAAPVDPFVSPIVAAAATQARQRLDEARAKDRDQVDRLVAYLRAMVEAAKGLEIEADELLSQGRWMDWGDEEQRQAFLRRCGGYLDVDSLRVQLTAALEGLDESRGALRERAAARLQRSGTRSRREAVLADVDAALVRYKQYLDDLSLGPKTSGVGAAELDWVRHRIVAATTPEQLASAKADALPVLEGASERRFGHEVLGAIEALVVRVQDAFA
jgi:hypothetical protein